MSDSDLSVTPPRPSDSSETVPPSAPAYGIAPSGFRLPMATRLGRVRLQVADLSRSIAFYQRVIGLRTVERQGERGREWATLAAHGDDRVLVELHEHVGAAPISHRGRLGLFHFAILVPDRPALGRFLAHLGTLGARAGMSDHFVSEALYLNDPDGLGIEVYVDRPRGEWRSVGSELEMTTLPLDARSVLEAAAGAEWTGMPAGTVIGHVHLHVGDLDRAAAFFHGALGFDKTVWSYPGALFMAAGGYHHHLGTNTWARNATPPADGDARLLEWEILVPDESAVDAAASSLAAAGIPSDRDATGLRVRDPWGTQVLVRT